MSTKDDAVVRGLLAELVKEEDALSEADRELSEATVRFNIASRKYAAIRDLLMEDMDCDPYAKDVGLGRIALSTLNRNISLGRFRFIHLPIGDAVVMALKEAEGSLTLEQIVKVLRGGGVQRSEAALTRAVNAALMKTSGVAGTKEGKYKYEEEE